ncbi:MAG: hypothetical protein KBE65_14620 [Phycisphaerae bacterium]|nr:hypothetical protein [Phycisphaerae bacterium]
MRKTTVIISLVMLVCPGRLSAQSVEESLDRMRGLLPQLLVAGQTDATRQYAETLADIIEQARSNPAAKGAVAGKFRELARKEMPAVNERQKLSPAQTEDFVYAMQLVDILVRVDPQAFLSLSEDLLADAKVSSLYKNSIFSRVLSKRAAISVADPNALRAYDKGVLSLGMRFIDEADGARFTFGDRGDFRNFVHHLIGYEASRFPLPPIDREKGLQFARAYVAKKQLFVENEWYMGQIARFDPQVRQEYVRALKEHVDNPERPKWVRIEYAEKLVGLGELDRKRLDDLKELPDDAGMKYEFDSRQAR